MPRMTFNGCRTAAVPTLSNNVFPAPWMLEQAPSPSFQIDPAIPTLTGR